MAEIEGGNPGSGPAPQQEGDGGNISSPALVLQSTEEPWTMDEMEEAEPCDIIEIDEDKLARAAARASVAESAGGEMAIEGGEPEVETAEPDTQATTGGYDYPAPFTRFEVFSSYTVYPYRCVGKLFFKRGSRSYVCSAASIGKDAIWSAGHCLHAGNNKASGWSTNVVFVPAYKDGAAPYGQWQVKQMWVRTAWYKNGNPGGLCQDMGGAILHRKNNRKISQVVGWLGFAWNWNRYQHWCQFGYPAAAPFDGKRLIENDSSYAYNGTLSCSPQPVGVGSDLTGGSSGGPWILKFGTQNYLNGCNSYRRGNKPQEMFSPYFNNNAKSLYDQLLRG